MPTVRRRSWGEAPGILISVVMRLMARVTVLARIGVLYVVGRQPVRGTRETFYFFTDVAWSVP